MEIRLQEQQQQQHEALLEKNNIVEEKDTPVLEKDTPSHDATTTSTTIAIDNSVVLKPEEKTIVLERARTIHRIGKILYV